MAKTGVIGAGSWGTALALVLHNNGHEVTLWSHSAASVESLLKNRELKDKLPGVKIPEAIQITNDLQQAVKNMDMLVLAGSVRLHPQHGPQYGSLRGGRSVNRMRIQGH